MATKKKSAKKPPKPAYDSIYQNALANFSRLRTGAENAYQFQNTELAADKTQALKPLNLEAPIRRENLRNDFAGRGLLQSTRYAEDLTDYEDDLAARKSGVQRSYDKGVNTNTRTRDQLLDSITMQKNQARLDWLQRRAAARQRGA